MKLHNIHSAATAIEKPHFALGREGQTPPLVSVIIPSYNQALYLTESVESVIAQTYPNWECIIVNDGSSDNTSDVARTLADRHPTRHLRLIEKNNGGLFDARNTGVLASSGDYVLFLDADDQIHPRFLEETVPILLNHANVGFVYTAVQHFGARSDIWSGGPFDPERFLRENQMTCTTLFRRHLFTEIGGLKAEMKDGFEDWEFWISCYERGWDGYYVDRPYFYYRKHPEPSMLEGIIKNKEKTEYLRAKIVSLHPRLYTLEEESWAATILRRGTPFKEQPMSVETLKSRSQITAARMEMHRRGIDFLDPGLRTELASSGWLSEVGDAVKSWDVLKTVEFIEKNVPADSPVLDVGAYCSEVICALHKLGFTQLSAIDLNHRLLQMPYSDRIRYVIGNFMETTFSDDSFAAITAISVIEHGFDSQRLLAEVSRLLKPGGYFIASVDYWPDKSDTRGLTAFGMDWRIFSRQEIQDLFAQAAHYGLEALGTADLESMDKTVDWNNRQYTFAWLVLQKVKAAGRPLNSPAIGPPKMKRVILAHTDFRFSPQGTNSGAEMATINLASQLAARGIQVSVFGLFDSGSEHYRGVEFRSFSDYHELCSALASLPECADLFIGNSVEALRRAAENSNFAFRMLWMHAPPLSYGPLIPEINRCADAVLHVSRFQMEAARRAGVTRREILFYNGFSSDIFHPATSYDPFQVVFAGALVPQKGVHLLVQAFPSISKAIPQAKLVICGSSTMWGEKPYLDAESISRAVPGITFTGAIPQEELAAVFSRSSLGVIPTIKEAWQDPFPLTPVEMQACGLPVLLSAAGGLPESIRQGITGFILDSDQPDMWAARIIELLRDRQRLDEMRTACVTHAQERFRWENLAAAFLDDVERLRGTGSLSDQGQHPAISLACPKPNKPEAIAFLSTWNQACGIATHTGFITEALRCALDQGGLSSTPIIILAEKTNSRTAADGANVHRCWHRHGDDFRDALRVVEETGVSHLHIQFQDGLFVGTDLLEFMRVLRERGVKVFVTLHSSESNLPLCAAVVNASDRAFTHLDQSVIRYIANGALPQRLSVIPHGIRDDLETPSIGAARNSLNVPPDLRLISTFGFIEPHKGIHQIIEAFPAVLRRHSAMFVVLGGGHPTNPESLNYLQRCRQLATELQIADRVKFLEGFLADEEVSKYLSASDAIVMNYGVIRNEISGAAAFALAHRRPLITSPVPAFSRLCSCTLQLSLKMGLSEALNRILGSPELEAHLVRQTQLHIADNSYRKVAALLLDEYCEATRKAALDADSHVDAEASKRTGYPLCEEPRVVEKMPSKGATRIGIDVRTLSDPDSVARGIGHYTTHHLRAIALLRPEWRFVLYGRHRQAGEAIRNLLEFSNIEYRNMADYNPDSVDLTHIPDPMSAVCSPPGMEVFKHQRMTIVFHDLTPFHHYLSYYDDATKADYRSRLASLHQGDSILLTNSDFTREDLIKSLRFPPDRIHTIMAGVNVSDPSLQISTEDSSRIKSRLGITNPFFLHVGALDRHKNFESVVTSFLRCQQFQSSQLVVVGRMAHGLKYYSEQLAQRNVKDIIFTGFLAREELEVLYREAVALVFLSLHEGFGFPVVEAMANHCPVVCSNTTSLPEVAGDAALLFSPTDTDGVSEAMLGLLNNPPQREEMKRRGALQAGKFSWKRTAIRTIAAWEKLLLDAPRQHRGDVSPSQNITVATVRKSSTAGGKRTQIPIAMPVCNRPDYLERVISALRECENINRFVIVTSEEPGFPAVSAIIEAIDFLPVARHTHEGRWGCNKNVTAAIDYAFELSDWAVILEDDIVPAKDFLNFMLWGLERYEASPQVISVCGYNRSPEQPDPRRVGLTAQHHWFTPWGWGTWRNRWQKFLHLHKDNLSQDQHSWDHFFNKGYFLLSPENVEVRPLISRIQNIGEQGTYVPSEEWQRNNQQTPYWHSNCELVTIQPDGFLSPEESTLFLKGLSAPSPSLRQDGLQPSPPSVPLAHPQHAQLIWYAPIFDPSGYADEARHLIQGVARYRDLRLFPLGRVSETFKVGMSGEERERLNRLMEGPVTPPFISLVHAPAYAFQRDVNAVWNIGRTVFETDRIPGEWVSKCNQMDEIWVPTEFNVDTFRRSGVNIPIWVIPEGVDSEFFKPGQPPLPVQGRRGFVFLSIFEWTYRKGWDLLLRAWAEAFKPDDDVTLILRTYPVDAIEFPDAKKEIEKRIGEYLQRECRKSMSQVAPIVVLGDQVPQREMAGLYCAADAFVLPSRGEGWGRPYIEAMACGLSVIGTRWGGNLSFMNDQNAYLIDVEGTVEVDARMEFAFYKGHRWSAPSVDHLKLLMRQVISDRDTGSSKGMQARQDIHECWSWDRGVQAILERLEGIESKIIPHGRGRFSDNESTVLSLPNSVMRVAWEGSQFVHHSLALINRELSLQLLEADHEVSILPFEPDQFGVEADPRFSKIASHVSSEPPSNVDVHVRHQWPPNFNPPPRGHWVMIQPWEYGRLPEDWIAPMSTIVDEIWVPSRHVLKSYLASGVPADRVQIVPNGVNTSLFHPEVLPCPLATDKSFKFLFVGGTIWRKGVDVLLEAYRTAFSREDEVVLVVKDMGQDTFYRGQGAGEKIRQLQEDPEAPEILYLTQMFTEQEMPGLFTACDCLVHPYRGEGFGLPVLEAMACGLPVVVTAGGATDDFCSTESAYLIASRPRGFTSTDTKFAGGVGWVLEPDLPDLVRLLRHVYENRHEAEEKAARALANARERYTWEKVAEKVVERMHAVVRRPLRRRLR